MRARFGVLLGVAAALAATAALIGSAGAAPLPSILGTWDTNVGPLVITGGSSATGTFGYADSWNEPIGHLNGTVTGATLTGTWSYEKTDHAPLDHGPFTLTVSFVNGKAMLAGKLIYEANGSVVTWQGMCKSGACAVDATAPTLVALKATGTRGAAVALRYQLYDASTKASEVITVTSGSRVLWRKPRPLHGAAVVGGTFGVSWTAPKKVVGPLRFTVVARDAAGNTSTSSATITLR